MHLNDMKYNQAMRNIEASIIIENVSWQCGIIVLIHGEGGQKYDSDYQK